VGRKSNVLDFVVPLGNEKLFTANLDTAKQPCMDVKVGIPKRVPRRHKIFVQGAPVDRFYQVVEGVVRTYALLNDGQRIIDGFHFAGDFFGFEQGHVHRFSADSAEEVTVRAFRCEELDKVFHDQSDLGRSFRSSVIASFSRAQDRALLLGLKTASERIAAFLLELARHASRTRTERLPMHRADIADYLGLSRETVSRVLSNLPTDCRKVPSKGFTDPSLRRMPIARQRTEYGIKT